MDLSLIPYFFSLAVISFMTSFLVYVAIMKSNKHYLSFLFIPAEKSPTNARLLGGLGTSLSTLLSSVFIWAINKDLRMFTKADMKLLGTLLVPIVLLSISGYIDDRFELRARYKLIFQFLSVFSFSFVTTKVVAENSPWLIFSASMFLGLALLNGTNLLDGLDSLTVKLGIVIASSFLFLGIQVYAPLLIFLSLSTIASLSAFYFFGKEPAKIYMGEIGGCVIGFLFYAQSVIAYEKYTSVGNGFKAGSWALIACALPICELGISFIRRIAMKKSPFRGDKLHLHHILKNKYKWTASKTSNVMAISLFTFNALSFVVAFYLSPLLAVCLNVSLIVSTYVSVCYAEWYKTKYTSIKENLFLLFSEKTVHVINSDLFKDVHIAVKTGHETSTPSRKKAA